MSENVSEFTEDEKLMLYVDLGSSTCPPELIDRVVKEDPSCKESVLARKAVKNKNCSLETFEWLLSIDFSGEDEPFKGQRTQYSAINNPSCPAGLRLKWLMDYGILNKEQSKGDGIVQDLTDRTDDSSLDEFENLVSGNSFGVKTAQGDWYTIDVAKDPNTSPEILHKILEKGEEGIVSVCAAKNPNTTPETLLMVWKRGWNDQVSAAILDNPKCPTSVLDGILLDGKDDWRSRRAAKNPNCPPEAILKWRVAIAQKEDNNSYVQNLTEKTDDTDLNDFEKLISKNKFNLKKTARFEEWYDKDVAQDPNTSPEIFTKILKKKNNDNVSMYAAMNLNCPPETLVMVLERGWNDHVSAYAAMNPNCPPEALAMVLERGKNNGVSRYAAENKNCPPEALAKILERGVEDDLSESAAKHMNCPPEALAMVLEREGYDTISEYAAGNPNCPPEILEAILDEGKNNRVSEEASKNPNCPLEAKMKWMRENGKLGNQKENDHVQDFTEKTDDTDLNDFENLLAKNKFNLSKISSMLGWYNMRTAKNPKTPPKVLQKILEQGKNDWVSNEAAHNPNCPPKALKMVLDRGNYDLLSTYAVENHNCPPEALVNVLEKGSEDDQMAISASKNPNCPLESKIKWMKETGQIGNETEKDHVQNLTEKTDDTDLNDFENLLAKNKFNLSKTAQVKRWYLTEVARDPNTSPEILYKIIDKGEKDKYYEISHLAAINPNCPPEALTMVLKKGRSDWVSQEAAENKNTPPEVLAEVLERGDSEWVSCYSAENPNCPPEALAKVLERGENDRVSRFAASSPNCPPEALRGVIEKEKGGEDELTLYAIQNPNCPPEILLRILENNENENENITCSAAINPSCPSEALVDFLKRVPKGKASKLASENPNCPLESKVKWMKENGMIEQEQGGIVQDLTEKTDDTDLNDFENLLASNSAILSKVAQKFDLEKIDKDGPNWYRLGIACDPETDPEILKKIVMLNKGDIIQEWALDNENTPPEALLFAVENGNSSMARHAARNSNANEAVIRSYMEKGLDDYTSAFLARRKDCPLDVRVKWMQATGVTTPEKKGDHVQDLTEKTDDSDLNDFENLLASNKFNLKKTAQKEMSGSWYNNRVSRSLRTPPEMLKQILEQGREDIISQRAAMNPNCPPEALKMVLERNINNGVSRKAVRHPNCPPEALRMVLEREVLDTVSEYAAENKNCPPEVLKSFFEECDYSDLDFQYVAQKAAGNPNCPQETLAKILERGENDPASYHAVQNSNCPLEYKVKWMRENGKISIEDEGDIVQDLTEKKDDTDLNDFENLLASNKFNLSKTAQQFNWYTREFAQGKDTSPWILAKILRQGGNDLVSRYAADNLNCPQESLAELLVDTLKRPMISRYAAGNPNCPPEALGNLLSKEWVDQASRSAARNPNCPPEALAMIVNRFSEGKCGENMVTRAATMNTNCPSESLAMLLESGLSENLSHFASQNPNCPLEAKVEWMRENKKIGREKEDSYIQDLTEKKDDTDLNDFENLLASNKFNLSKTAAKRDLRNVDRSWYNIEVSKNRNTSPEILTKILEKGNSDLISRRAIRNLNCPPETLAKVLEKFLENGDNFQVSIHAALNPNTPVEILTKILERGENDTVSVYASRNPNCPPGERLKWMTSRHTKEKEGDYIQDLTEKKDDTDLNDFENLLASNKFNLKKTAMPKINNAPTEEEKSWYNIPTVKDRNCPPEILHKMLEKGNDDYVSRRAAEHPNVTPESLQMVLDRDISNVVTSYAIQNENCSVDMFGKFLDRHAYPFLYHSAMNNPNCTLENRLKYLSDQGRLNEEDSDSYVQDLTEKKDDTDLNDFENLLSSNKFNLKKQSQNDEEFSEEDYMRSELDEEDDISADRLREMMDANPEMIDTRVKIAQQENCPPDVLDRLAGDDMYINRRVSRNPNTSGETLSKIIRGGTSSPLTLQYCISHDNCPPEELFEIVKNSHFKNYVLEAVQNQNCPPEALVDAVTTARLPQITEHAIRNRNFPSEFLAKMVRDGHTYADVAAKNPNCPLREKLSWMREHGEVKHEDNPALVQDLTEKHDDTDFNDFENLISNNKTKIIKVAQHEKWYNANVASNINTPPEILYDILAMGLDEPIEWNATENKNCPPKGLSMVLEREKNDQVSVYAAGNLNCPPEALAQALKRGDTAVGRTAARNKSCPPKALAQELLIESDLSRYVATNSSCPSEALAQLLHNGENNKTSLYAARNPNCPRDARFKWRIDIAQKEKEGDIVQDLTERTDDTDLNDFENLLASNKFNLKKTAQVEEGVPSVWNVTKDPNTSPETLGRILLEGEDRWMKQKAAMNPNCSPEALAKVLERGEDDIVSQTAAGNLNCPPEALRMVVERGIDDQTTIDAVWNINCPPEALAMILDRGESNQVSRAAARNLNCPPEALAMVLNRESVMRKGVARCAVRNPNCPPEELVKILERGAEDMWSSYVMKNPNCPLKAKIKFMNENGKIQKEKEGDIVQDLTERADDTDLNDFENLLASNKFNLKKTAQNEEWYKSWVATSDKTPPEILTKILEKGLDDPIEWAAIKNKNCPPETLAMVLERGENNQVSYNAASSKNCPPEALAKVLERGRDDLVSELSVENPNCPPEALKKVLESGNEYSQVAKGAVMNINCPPELLAMEAKKRNSYVSRSAVMNKNCPPEALIEILERGINDNISRVASENPNCPPEAILKWRVSIAQKEDNNSYVQDLTERTDDSDLNNFENLLAKNKFNLKKTAQGNRQELNSPSIARDSNTSPEVLAKIVEFGLNEMTLAALCATSNPNCPPETLALVLERDANDLLNQDAAAHLSTPPEALAKFLEKDKYDFASMHAAENPNCPPETLSKILSHRGGLDRMTRSVFNNPNCTAEVLLEAVSNCAEFSRFVEEIMDHKNFPVTEKLKWIIKNKSQKENSNDHVQDLTERTDDSDLNDFESLVSKNKFNLKKQSQNNDLPPAPWYTLDVAKDPNASSESLGRILDEGKTDVVSYQAVQNANCPPEALARAMNREDNSIVTQYAGKHPNTPTEALIEAMEFFVQNGSGEDVAEEVAHNPNCPPEALAMALEWRPYHEDHCLWVPRKAASHPNCPPEALKKAIKRNYDDGVTEAAIMNTNTPLEYKVQWMRENGRMGKEEGSDSYVQDLTERTDDTDLNDFENLLSSNKFNLKKHSQNEEWYTNQVADNQDTLPEGSVTIQQVNEKIYQVIKG